MIFITYRTTVAQINQSGIYTISNEVFRLKFKIDIESDQDDMSNRTFNRDEVQELRSKLMLITTGADGKKNVETFVKTLSLIEVLSKNLEDLVQAGCNLYSKWKATIFCDPIRKVSVLIDFGHHGGVIQGDENLEHNLHQIASFLKVIKVQISLSSSLYLRFLTICRKH